MNSTHAAMLLDSASAVWEARETSVYVTGSEFQTIQILRRKMGADSCLKLLSGVI